MNGPMYASRAYREQQMKTAPTPEPEVKPAEADLFPKHVGGGYYELSSGDRVKGKDAALTAQAELD